MTDRKKLEEANNAYKVSIEKEISEVKSDVNRAGKGAILGVAIALSVLALSALLSSEGEFIEEKPKKKKSKKKAKLNQSGVLLDSLKEEALLIGLNFASQKLANFIKDLKEE